MKFSALVSIAPQEKEEAVLETAKQGGAGGVTILRGKGLGLEEKKTFFGLTYERSESVLIFVLERKLSAKILKSLFPVLNGSGIAFTIPMQHLTGIDLKQVIQFEQNIKEDF